MLALLAAAKDPATKTPHHWPALIVGVVVSIYWLRVMLMVRQTRKKAGRSANLIPPEPLGRLLRIIWTPITLLWIFLPFMAFQVRYRQRYPDELKLILGLIHLPAAIGWLAAIAAVLCLLATFVCWQRMGTSWRMGIDPNDRTRLVCSGPYAYVRHPIYGLSTLLMISSVLAVPNVLMMIVGTVHIILLQWEARREESHLTHIHGDEYRAYARQTGRFLPRSFRRYGA